MVSLVSLLNQLVEQVGHLNDSINGLSNRMVNMERNIDKIKQTIFFDKSEQFENFSFGEFFPIATEEQFTIIEEKLEDEQFSIFLVSITSNLYV